MAGAEGWRVTVFLKMRLLVGLPCTNEKCCFKNGVKLKAEHVGEAMG